MTHLHLTDIDLRYPIFHAGHAYSLFRSMARQASGGVLGRNDHNDITMVHALRGVSMRLHEGDRIGLVGRNGAGKSTLLRVIAGVHWPQSGTLEASGRISSLLDPNSGIDVEKTGLENIDFVGRLHGFDRAARAALMDDVVTFTELGDYLRLPVRTYSSGMMVRLSFGLATALPGDILAIDEIIGAGDVFFMERARERARSLYKRAKILIMASHSDAILRDFCEKAVWIDQGLIVDYGTVDEVVERYALQTPRFPAGTHFDSASLKVPSAA